jgi:tetratricopeptide (TPR) repeat protein
MDDRLKIALRFVLLLLIGSLIGISPSAYSVTENTRKVRLAFAAEDYSTGAEILIDLAEENPWWTTLWESAGNAAYLGGDYPTAKKAYKKALQKNDLSIEGQIKLGQTYLQVGEQVLAVETWQALEDSSQALEELALFYEGNGEITRAIEIWHKYLTLSADGSTSDQIYHFGLLIAADTPPKSLPYLDQSREEFPEAAGVASAIRGAVSEEPAYQYVTAGQALAAINQWNLAAYAFDRATSLRQDYQEAWLYLGEALQHLDKPGEDVLDVLETGLALNEDSPLANLFLGLYWQRQGSHPTALDYFQVVADLWPANADVRVETGKSLAALGQLNAALEKYQEAVELDPLDGKYYNQLTEFCVLYDYQVKEIGLPASRVAVQLDPSDEVSLDIMGQVLLALDDNQNAVKFFQMALESNPIYAPAHYHLGIYYSAYDDSERTVYHLQQTLKYTENPALFDQAERLLSNYQ